ncbi:unnamed protein product [Echinostoma caproni]|uniref:B41 domain-containing protein n=1 Tax=Echinostoma caproni TaxID=27848 RepID=A0A183AVU8_9TREM|nr:unnamed protein product [Echinostoma caproni]
MLADGHYVDGSWLLTVHIDALNIDRQVRVQGDWSVGELLTELTEGLPAPLTKPPKPHEISLRSGGVRTGWGDHQLWWPAKSRWLIHSRISLNQYGLQADALLRLVPVYGRLRVQLPDLQIRDFVDVNYADPVFRVTVSICRQLNIRHPEELSLCYPITQTDLKHTRFVPAVIDRRLHAVTTLGRRVPFQRSATINTTHTQTKQSPNYNTLGKFSKENSPELTVTLSRRKSATSVSQTSEHLFGPPRLRDRGHGTTGPVCPSWYRLSKANSVNLSRFGPPCSPGSMHTLAFELRTFEDPYLASSPVIGVEDACYKGYLVRPNGFLQRLRLNSTWLDSARSLMEQGIDMSYRADLAEPAPPSQPSSPPDVTTVAGGAPQSRTLSRTESKLDSSSSTAVPILWLRYKYGTFYDLNVKYDAVRINQLYEQAKWSVITEAIEATDDEACLLAALQAHVSLDAIDRSI